MKTRISKAYRGSEHIGWKKTVGGREWFLGYGTNPTGEAKAIALATALEDKWQLAKLGGADQLTDTDFQAAKDLIAGRPLRAVHQDHRMGSVVTAPKSPHEPVAAVCQIQPIAESNTVQASLQPRRWLFASIDEFVATTKCSMKSDGSNGDHVLNVCERILRAKDAIEDLPLDLFRRKQLDDWLRNIRALPSKQTGAPLSPVTVRNLVSGVRAALSSFAEWEWWSPPVLWERAFKPYSIKKLQTPTERKRQKKRPPAHSLAEKRILWYIGREFERAMMALADWAGHTQKEVATLTFDEIIDVNGEMFIDRDRNKTCVHGRWWIPPEAAAAIRRVSSRTSRDPKINPHQLAFLTPCHQPLVDRADKNRRARNDYIGHRVWPTLLRAASSYGVRQISYKYMRKATAQLIRDEFGKEVSRTFLAHADEDVQDEAYTRACLEKVEKASRFVYSRLKEMFRPISGTEWEDLAEQIARENASPKSAVSNVAA